MNDLIRPFAALRPRAEFAADVIAPPYDVVDAQEARALALNRPFSFLHVSRPEIDLPPGTDPTSEAAYAKGRDNLTRMIERGILVRDPAPALYVYRMTMGDHRQTGVALTASVRAYDENRIRKHELTRPDKERDRVRNIDALNAQTGPVLTAYRAEARIGALIDDAAAAAPLFDVTGPNGVQHAVWAVTDTEHRAALASALNGLDVLYIADGHHRSAAASRVAAARRGQGPTADRSAAYEYFLAVAFPDDELAIHDYNRVVADLAGLAPAAFVRRIESAFSVEPLAQARKPNRRRELSMYLAGRWYRLCLRRELETSDPVDGLDVSLLQRHIIEPVLGIAEPRTDPRIDFVGGIRGLAALEERVDSGGAAVAFALYPTSMAELMAVADAERLMPPKSTWFEPKLGDGLLSHVLD
jgi:uncharacterized protein (DUF1015 family)